MAAPVSSWIFLAFCVIGFGWTVTAIVRADRLGWGNMFWLLSGWLTSELALFHSLGSDFVALIFAATTDALGATPGRIGLGLMTISWAGLALAQWRAHPTGRLLEQSLRASLGDDYREQIPAARRAVLLQIHGGGWVMGNKHEQALPLIHHLAARGWVVVTPNYRLSPRARFPDPLVDCKRALAWVRRNIAAQGGDPSFVAVTGGSAGGHLAALMALTANDPQLQPGFESVDTTVAEARLFADRLRSVSRHPVVYTELPGAQHAWDVFRSVRAMESVQAVTRFLEWTRATTDRGR